MRRLSLPLVLVVVVAACRGGGTAPTPVQAPFWEGTAGYAYSLKQGEMEAEWILVGPVTWIKEKDPELAPLDGAASYIIQSGSLTVSRTGVVGPCTVNGDTTLTLKPGDGSLVLSPNGTYSGHIRADKQFSYTISCPDVASGSVPDIVAIRLDMEGQVDNLRMKGRMERVVGSVTMTGSWDFLAK